MAATEDVPGWASRDHINDVSSRGLASFVAEQVRIGELKNGEFLPQVRPLAQALRISPATVSGAWQLLKKRGLLVGAGKSGVRITGAAGLVNALETYSTVSGSNDLRLLYPDLFLLPPLDQALVGAAQQPRLNEYYDSAILPDLQAVVEPSWPYPAEAFAVANGASDAIFSLLQANSVPGDRIIVESPTQPQLLSLLVDLGLTILPVSFRHDGLDLQQLRDALHARPMGVFLQPRAQIPTGLSANWENITHAADILGGVQRPMIIEYDDLNSLARSEHISIGTLLPSQTVVVRSYEKSYGPDLRLAVIGGPAHVMRSTHAQMRLTRQWTSRILQSALAWLLSDNDTAKMIQNARLSYNERLDKFLAMIAARGVECNSMEGFCVWIPVLNEDAAAANLARQGVLVLKGKSSYQGRSEPHIRIATSRLDPELMPRLADMVSDARSVFA